MLPVYGGIMTPQREVVMETTIKTERITARVSERVKETLMDAADLAGATLNQFLIQAALEKAERILEKDQVVALSREDAKRFFKVLDNPPEPNAKLIEAAKRYKSSVG